MVCRVEFVWRWRSSWMRADMFMFDLLTPRHVDESLPFECHLYSIGWSINPSPIVTMRPTCLAALHPG